ncbi:hypothetical protein HY640_00695, partial [Candidatus Woesearchaeota archaeon]|nr:hypothetical protein [Candidatus Woesearchaeota archaeon]
MKAVFSFLLYSVLSAFLVASILLFAQSVRADFCGDGLCDPGEEFGCISDCLGPAPSPVPVPPSSFCGDGLCDGGEQLSCPGDCAPAPSPVP